MELKKFTNVPKQETNKTQKVHYYEEYQNEFPFAVLETTYGEEGEEVTDFEIILGDSLASPQKFSTKEEAERYINRKPFDLIVTLIYQTLKNMYNYEQERKETTESNN